MSLIDFDVGGRQPCSSGVELTRTATARQWDRSGGADAAEGEGVLRAARPRHRSLATGRDYSLSVKNRIEIAKALAFNARIFIMDEPTSRVSRPEVDKLFALVRQLKARGLRIIYITHRMEEIYGIADRISVLRDGRHVGNRLGGGPRGGGADPLDDRSRAEQAVSRCGGPQSAPWRLEVQALSVPKPGAASTKGGSCLVRDVSLSVRAGRDRRLAGLQGSGNTELLRGIFGAYGRLQQGKVSIDGRAIRDPIPRRSVQQGLAYLTSDRKGTGPHSRAWTSRRTSPSRPLESVSPALWMRHSMEWQIAQRHVRALGIRAADVRQAVPCSRACRWANLPFHGMPHPESRRHRLERREGDVLRDVQAEK